MSKADDLLAERRKARDAAWTGARLRLAKAQSDLQPVVLKQRVLSELRRKSIAAANTSFEIASEYPGIVAATATALVVWFARRPLGKGTAGLVKRLWKRKAKPKTPIERMASWLRQWKEIADD